MAVLSICLKQGLNKSEGTFLLSLIFFFLFFNETKRPVRYNVSPHNQNGIVHYLSSISRCRINGVVILSLLFFVYLPLLVPLYPFRTSPLLICHSVNLLCFFFQKLHFNLTNNKSLFNFKINLFSANIMVKKNNAEIIQHNG